MTLPILCAAPAAAQCGPQWVLVATTGPSPRAACAMAYDTARKRAVLFGGTASPDGNAETWEWDGIAWERVALSGPQPDARVNSRMAYDAARGECVMFGRENSQSFESTWLWNGIQWRSDEDNPSGNRSAYAVAYDPLRQRVVLHGGQIWIPSTFEWDGAQWLFHTNSVPPEGRSRHVAVFYPPRGKVVMFGGYAAPGVYVNEMWEWDGDVWSAVPQISPPPGRWVHAMAFDAARSRLVMVGGGDATVCGFSDTWEFDGTAWQPMNSGAGFPTIAAASAVYDEARQRVTLFGGLINGCTSQSGATWVWTAKPALTSRPQSVTICPSATASFSITAVGNNTSLDFQWRKGGVPIADEPGHISGTTTSSLTIANAVVGDSGPYDCVLTNQCGSVISDAATLTICPADFNCDGFVSGDDFDGYVAAFETGDTSADFNQDGFVSGDDFDLFVAAFEAGC